MKDITEKLNEVQRVEISPYVWTRLQQKMEGRASSFSPRWTRVIAVSFCVLLALNVFVLNYARHHMSAASDIAESMNLIPHNSIYEQ